MNSLLRLIIATVAITAVLTKQIETGPQTSDERTAVTQKTPKRFVAEEVVIYLTPSQLQAIQEGKGFINSGPSVTTEAPQESQDTAESDQLEEDDNSQLQSNESDTQISQEDGVTVASLLPAEELNSEEIEDEPQFSRTYRLRKQKNVIALPDDLYTLLSNYPELLNQPAEPEAKTGESVEDTKVEPEGSQPDTAQKQRFKLVPYESATETSKPSTTEPTLNDPIRERWLRWLEQNRTQLRNPLLKQDKVTTTTTIPTPTQTEEPQAKLESTLAKLRYSAKYRSKSQTYQSKEQRSKNDLEKQNKLPKLVQRANDEGRKEAKKANQQQKSVLKQVRVHTSVFIPIPESAKIPINSPISLKGLKPVSILANRAGVKDIVQKKSESQTRAQRTEPKASLPNNLSVGVNNTSTVESRTSTDADKEVPVEINLRRKGKPERITIIRHLFDN